MSPNRRLSFPHSVSLLAWRGPYPSWLVHRFNAPLSTHPARLFTAADPDPESLVTQGSAPLRAGDSAYPGHASAASNFHAEKGVCHDALGLISEQPGGGTPGDRLPHPRTSLPQHAQPDPLEGSERSFEAPDWRQGPPGPTITPRQSFTERSSSQRRACHSTLPCTTSYRLGGEYR